MRTRPDTAPAVKQISLDARADLLRKAQMVRRGATELRNGSTSLAARSRMQVLVNQLSAAVLALDPPIEYLDHSGAILAAAGTHAWDAIVDGCEAIEALAEGKVLPAPMPPAPPLAPEAVAAIEADATAAVAAVLKRVDVPPADRGAPDPAPADPVPDQAARPVAPVDQASEAPASDPAPAPAPIAVVAAVEQLGEVIRLARVGKRMTQQEVATAAGVGRRLVVELESGKGKSDIGRVFAVCGVVGVTLTAAAA